MSSSNGYLYRLTKYVIKILGRLLDGGLGDSDVGHSVSPISCTSPSRLLSDVSCPVNPSVVSLRDVRSQLPSLSSLPSFMHFSLKRQMAYRERVSHTRAVRTCDTRASVFDVHVLDALAPRTRSKFKIKCTSLGRVAGNWLGLQATCWSLKSFFSFFSGWGGIFKCSLPKYPMFA